jgi:predicted RNA polymerase sigma factor
VLADLPSSAATRARAEWRRAADLTDNARQRELLLARAAALSGG